MRRINSPWLVAASAALALAAASAGSGSAASTWTAKRCGARSVHAIVARKHRCLRDGDSCRARLNSTYHRYVFDCVRGYLDFWWDGLLRRPLHIPTLAAGSPCPASEQRGTLGDHGNTDVTRAPAFGPGPAYPTLGVDGGRAVLRYLVSWGYEGWDGTKALWTVPRYYGPYAVRGRRLDGPEELRFDQGPQWTNQLHEELRLVGPQTWLHPAATFLRAPGCYAYQVDGRGFSYLILFEARAAS